VDMDMFRAMVERTTIAILAKAPLPGLAKTRLVSVLGTEGTTALASRLIRRVVATACAADLGPVTLWAAPDDRHPLFAALRDQFGIALDRQPDGDLGARMRAAVDAAGGPALVIGTDCPVLTVEHLREAADALNGCDVVIAPAEDGGYVLIGMRQPQPALFARMHWGVGTVMQDTRRRI